ncbi:hypothetical protein RUM43_007180 [Polyplax serrata]|uniref:limulus clotting factor C n=1 Tax=Polyplax serrata TaxID=468196 RepID=A0AAN8S5B4_POLSC
MVIGSTVSHSLTGLHHKPETIFPPHHNEFKEIIGIELQRIPIHGQLEGLEKQKHEIMKHERELAHDLLEKELLEKELKRKHEILELEQKELEHKEHEILEHEKRELEHRQLEILEHEKNELEHRQHEILEREKNELEHRQHEILEHEHKELEHRHLLDHEHKDLEHRHEILEHEHGEIEHREHDFLHHNIPPHDVLQPHLPHNGFEHHTPPFTELEHHSPRHNEFEHHLPPHQGFQHHTPLHKGIEHHIPKHDVLEHRVHGHNTLEHHVPPLEHDLEHEHEREHEHELEVFEHERREHERREHDILVHEPPIPWDDPNFAIGEEIHHREEEFHHDELFPVSGGTRNTSRRGGSNRRTSSSNRGSSNNRGNSNRRRTSNNRGRSNNNNRSNSNNRGNSNNRNNSNNRRSNNRNNSNNRNTNNRRNSNTNINTQELFNTRNRQNNNNRSNSNNSNRRNNNSNNNSRRNSNLQELAILEEEILVEPEVVEQLSRPERHAEFQPYSNVEETTAVETKMTHEPATNTYAKRIQTNVGEARAHDDVGNLRKPGEFEREEAQDKHILYVEDQRRPSDHNPETADRRGEPESRKSNGALSTGSARSDNIFKQPSTSFIKDEQYLTLDGPTPTPNKPSQSNSRPSNFHNFENSRPNQFGGSNFGRPSNIQQNKQPSRPTESFFVNEGNFKPQRPQQSNFGSQQSFGSGFSNQEGSALQRPSNINFNYEGSAKPAGSNFGGQENQPVQRPFGQGQYSNGHSGFPGSSGSFNSQGSSGQEAIKRPFSGSFSNAASSNSQTVFTSGSGQRPIASGSGSQGSLNFQKPLGSNFRPQRPQREGFNSGNINGEVPSESLFNAGSSRPFGPSPTNFDTENTQQEQFGSNFNGQSTSPKRPSVINFNSQPGSDSASSGCSTTVGHRPQKSPSFITDSSYVQSNSGYNQYEDVRPSRRPSSLENDNFAPMQHNTRRPLKGSSSSVGQFRPDQMISENTEEHLGGGRRRPQRPEYPREGVYYSNQEQEQQYQPGAGKGGYYKETDTRPTGHTTGLLTAFEESLYDSSEDSGETKRHHRRENNGRPSTEETYSSHQKNPRPSHSNSGPRRPTGEPSRPRPSNGNISHNLDVISLQEDSWLWPDEPKKGNRRIRPTRKYDCSDMTSLDIVFPSRETILNLTCIAEPGKNKNNGSHTTARPTTTTTGSGVTNFKRHPNYKLLPTEACGIDLGNKIIGGTNTQLDEFPWMALLQHTSERGQSLGFGCGGSLISPRYILTAAHCISGPAIKNNVKVTKIRLGEYDTSKEVDCQGEVCNHKPVDAHIEQIIVHPQYRSTDRSQQHDIALIRLREDVKNSVAYINPICLPWNGTPRNITGERFTVAGWGRTANGQGTSSKTKQKVTLPGVSLEDCSPFYNRINIQLQKTQMCAGGEKDKDSCQGDSGGPLMMSRVTDNQVRWEVHGIVSFGPEKCGVDKVAGVYTKVSEYLQWILDTIKK